MEREALKLALEALKRIKTYGDVFLSRSHEQKPYDQVCEAIEVAEKALAQPAQESAAWATKEDFYRELDRRVERMRKEMEIKTVTMRCKDYDVALNIVDMYGGHVVVGQVSFPPQPAQEPVAWMNDMGTHIDLNVSGRGIPLYATPPQRSWVELEGEEIRNLWEEATKPDRSTVTMVTSFARAIEAKLKEKNNGA